MSAEERSKLNRNRLIVLALCLTFGFSVIVAQLIKYQMFMHDELKAKGDRYRVRTLPIDPPRGLIFDLNGQPLAMNTLYWEVSVDPPMVTNDEEKLEVLTVQLSELLDLPPDEVFAALASKEDWILLKRFARPEVGEQIIALDANGVHCRPLPKRVYPSGSLFAHVLGIVTDAGRGFFGIEEYHNQLLMGSAGQIEYEQDPSGFPLPIPALGINPPKMSTSLILTLDSNIQYIVEQELQRALELYNAESGTIIVLDPKTGGILANVSYPSYDPNASSRENLEGLADPAVSSLWEPGSIFKIVTWAAGLDTGTITPGTSFLDDGTMEVVGRTIRNWDKRGHGRVTMIDGLVESLNTVAAFISTSMGKDTFYGYLRRFGFGDLTDVDLAAEGPGIMKLPGDSNWFPSELGTNSFGQGIAVTPMQMVSAASAVANGGLLMKPHIVHQYLKVDEEGEQRVIQVEPRVARRAISEETARTVTNLLVEVVDQGATKAQIPGYRVAGKTGTAQVPTPYGYHATDTIASFIGYAPADDPAFIVLVKLDRPRESPWGSQTAAPTFKAVAEQLLVYMHVPPDAIRVAESSNGP